MVSDDNKHGLEMLRLIVSARTNKEVLTHGMCVFENGHLKELQITQANICLIDNVAAYPPFPSTSKLEWGPKLAEKLMFEAGEFGLQMAVCSTFVMKFEVNREMRALLIDRTLDDIVEVVLGNCDDLDVDAMGEDFTRTQSHIVYTLIDRID